MPRTSQNPSLRPSPPSTSEPRRGLRREEAARYVGVSPRKFDSWVDARLMPQPRRIGGVVLWDMRQLDLALDEMFNHGDESEPNPWDQPS
jgi:predicted DNA-binding transcriptional regulator AlpA